MPIEGESSTSTGVERPKATGGEGTKTIGGETSTRSGDEKSFRYRLKSSKMVRGMKSMLLSPDSTNATQLVESLRTLAVDLRKSSRRIIYHSEGSDSHVVVGQSPVAIGKVSEEGRPCAALVICSSVPTRRGTFGKAQYCATDRGASGLRGDHPGCVRWVKGRRVSGYSGCTTVVNQASSGIPQAYSSLR